MTTNQLAQATSLEKYFSKFRKQIIGIEQTFVSPYGLQKIVYADWTASGRMYLPIERLITEEIAPFIGNTHTETTITGSTMTIAYHRAKKIIKDHCNAKDDDILITSNSGMTGVINKFQRILGLKLHERYHDMVSIKEEDRPIVFCSHMEHHSNQTTWLETICDVVVIPPDDYGYMDLDALKGLIQKYNHRKTKILAITAASNVTGITTPFHQAAGIIHRAGGLCFVDFACSAPYVDINMHPDHPDQYLDAIYFSPHKFLGGPSSSGVLIFNQKLYKNRVPDNPGGGTVDWTNPWGEHKYHEEIEAREDGGTPGFIQSIRIALSIMLKEEMQVKNILNREHELMSQIWERLEAIPNLHILAPFQKDRLGIFSFYIDDLHYNLGVKILNDMFGIQTRGGCSCAGTYGHYLLNVTYKKSKMITQSIDSGCLIDKPGWIRMSIHPTMTSKEIDHILSGIEHLAAHHKDIVKDYEYCPGSNEFIHKDQSCGESELVDRWFSEKLS